MRYHIIPISLAVAQIEQKITSVAENVEKSELLCLADGKVK